MLNGWTITSGILCVLFVAAATFGQEQSDSHIITVTKEIDVAKLNENVEDLTKTVEKLDTTVETLNTTVGELKTTVARIDERTKGISNWQYVILAGIFGHLLLSVYDRKKQNSEKKNYLYPSRSKRGNAYKSGTSEPERSNSYTDFTG